MRYHNKQQGVTPHQALKPTHKDQGKMAFKDKLKKDLGALREIFKSRNMAVLFGLGFSSGLPLVLTGETLKNWLTEANVSLVIIGIFGMISIPYSLKLLWAPLLDRYQLPILGRRRGWILLTQIALFISISLLALFGTSSLGLFAVCAALIALFSASQDIVIDGYRADLLSTQQIALGMTVFLLGYRVGMLMAGAGAGIIGDAFDTKTTPDNWSWVYMIMASLVTFGVISTLAAPEPVLEDKPPSTIAGAFEYPFLAFLRRNSALMLLAFMFIYKLADTLLLTSTFYLKLGFTKTEIAFLAKTVGTIASILGIAAGGLMTAKLGIRRSLWVGGILTALANLTFTALAIIGKSYLVISVAVALDAFCLSLASIPYNCLLVSLCDKRFSATQFAVLASISSMGGRLLSGLSGYLAEQLGWAVFFSSTVLAAIPGLVILALLPRESVEVVPREEEQQDCPSCSAKVMGGISFCDSCGAHLGLTQTQEAQLNPLLLKSRRAILFAGFVYAVIGIVLPIFAPGWKVDRAIPFIVLHFGVLTLHVGLWAWAKLFPARALRVAMIVLGITLVSDAYFREDLFYLWLPARAAVWLLLALADQSARRAQRILSQTLPPAPPYRG